MTKLRRATTTRREVVGALSAMLGCATLPGCAVSSPGRNTPESQGIDSGAIEAFLDAIAVQDVELHSLMILRHGAVVTEGWWSPHKRGAPHDLYSASKTFTSTAIGLAVADGHLATSTKIADLFVDELPTTVEPRLQRLQVSHLLTMATGHDGLPSSARVTATDDWVRAFLAEPMVHEPGSEFLYENTASYMLSAIVQKLYGKTLVEFLDDRLFAPLGIATPSWETCPRGINTGGWGLSLSTDALARFGQLYLDEGRWNGRQLIPASWIAEASAAHIQQLATVPVTVNGIQYTDPDLALEALRVSSDFHQGYGYQIWRARHGAYDASGAFGQFVIVVPQHQAVIVTTAGELDVPPILDAIWEHLLPAMQERPLALSRPAQRRLRDRLADLALACPEGRAIDPIAASLDGRRFQLTDNPLGAHALSFAWAAQTCILTLDRSEGRITVPLGFGRWIDSRVRARGLVPWFPVFGKTVHPDDVAVAGAFAWTDDRVLTLRFQYVETPHHHLVTVRIADGGLSFEASDGWGPISHFTGSVAVSN